MKFISLRKTCFLILTLFSVTILYGQELVVPATDLVSSGQELGTISVDRIITSSQNKKPGRTYIRVSIGPNGVYNLNGEQVEWLKTGGVRLKFFRDIEGTTQLFELTDVQFSVRNNIPLQVKEIDISEYYNETIELSIESDNFFTPQGNMINGISNQELLENLELKVEVIVESLNDVKRGSQFIQIQPTDMIAKPCENCLVRNDVSKVRFEWELPEQNQFFESFDLQVYKLEPGLVKSGNRLVAQDLIEWERAATIEVKVEPGATPYYEMSLAEGTGYYFWRVRPIGNYYPGGRANVLNYGEWTSNYDTDVEDVTSMGLFNEQITGNVYSRAAGTPQNALNNEGGTISTNHQIQGPFFYYYQFDEDLNWIYGKVLTEGSRQAETMTYANGLNQVLQTQTKLFSKDEVIGSQTVYDYSARPALQSLPSPLNDNKLGYKENFFQNNNNQIYSAKDFDRGSSMADVIPIDPDETNLRDSVAIGTPNHYYSNLNTQGAYKDLVPTAGGFPFTRTLFYNDATGRVKQQSGPGGAMHLSLDGRRNVNTYYSTVTDEELDVIFGSEASDTGSVYKVINTDPNSVSSVSYINKVGQVVATCINSGASLTQNAKLDDIGNEESIEVSSEMASARFSEGEFVASNSLSIVNDQSTPLEVAISYDITPNSFSRKVEDVNQNTVIECRTCDYRVEILIRNTELPQDPAYNQKLVYTVTPDVDPNCGTTPPTYTITGFTSEITGGIPMTTVGSDFSFSLPTGTYIVERRIYANATGLDFGDGPENQTALEYYQAQLASMAESWTGESNCCGPFNPDPLVSDWVCNEVPEFCQQDNSDQFVSNGHENLRDLVLIELNAEQSTDPINDATSIVYQNNLANGGANLISNTLNSSSEIDALILEVNATGVGCLDLYNCYLNAKAGLEANQQIMLLGVDAQETQINSSLELDDLTENGGELGYDADYDFLFQWLTCTGGDYGITGYYFNDLSPEGSNFNANSFFTNKVDPTPAINLDPATVSGLNTQFSVYWEGTFNAPIAGDYTFRIDPNDGGKFYFNNNELIDTWGNDAPAAEGVKTGLMPGEYPIAIELQNFDGLANLDLQYKVGSGDFQDVVITDLKQQCKGDYDDVVVWFETAPSPIQPNTLYVELTDPAVQYAENDPRVPRLIHNQTCVMSYFTDDISRDPTVFSNGLKSMSLSLYDPTFSGDLKEAAQNLCACSIIPIDQSSVIQGDLTELIQEECEEQCENNADNYAAAIERFVTRFNQTQEAIDQTGMITSLNNSDPDWLEFNEVISNKDKDCYINTMIEVCKDKCDISDRVFDPQENEEPNFFSNTYTDTQRDQWMDAILEQQNNFSEAFLGDVSFLPLRTDLNPSHVDVINELFDNQIGAGDLIEVEDEMIDFIYQSWDKGLNYRVANTTWSAASQAKVFQTSDYSSFNLGASTSVSQNVKDFTFGGVNNAKTFKVLVNTIWDDGGTKGYKNDDQVYEINFAVFCEASSLSSFSNALIHYSLPLHNRIRVDGQATSTVGPSCTFPDVNKVSTIIKSELVNIYINTEGELVAESNPSIACFQNYSGSFDFNNLVNVPGRHSGLAVSRLSNSLTLKLDDPQLNTNISYDQTDFIRLSYVQNDGIEDVIIPAMFNPSFWAGNLDLTANDIVRKINQKGLLSAVYNPASKEITLWKNTLTSEANNSGGIMPEGTLTAQSENGDLDFNGTNSSLNTFEQTIACGSSFSGGVCPFGYDLTVLTDNNINVTEFEEKLKAYLSEEYVPFVYESVLEAMYFEPGDSTEYSKSKEEIISGVILNTEVNLTYNSQGNINSLRLIFKTRPVGNLNKDCENEVFIDFSNSNNTTSIWPEFDDRSQLTGIDIADDLFELQLGTGQYTIADFENPGDNFIDGYEQGAAFVTPTVNPDPSTINPSANIITYARPKSEINWEYGLEMSLSSSLPRGKVDAYFMDVRGGDVSSANIPIYLVAKKNDGDPSVFDNTSQADVYAVYKARIPNQSAIQWHRLTFELDRVIGDATPEEVDQLVLFIDPMGEKPVHVGSSGFVNYQLDNLEASSLDFTAFGKLNYISKTSDEINDFDFQPSNFAYEAIQTSLESSNNGDGDITIELLNFEPITSDQVLTRNYFIEYDDGIRDCSGQELDSPCMLSLDVQNQLSDFEYPLTTENFPATVSDQDITNASDIGGSALTTLVLKSDGSIDGSLVYYNVDITPGDYLFQPNWRIIDFENSEFTNIDLVLYATNDETITYNTIGDGNDEEIDVYDQPLEAGTRIKNIDGTFNKLVFKFEAEPEVQWKNGADSWDFQNTYVAGDVVQFYSDFYQANFWTSGDQPDINSGTGQAWTLLSNEIREWLSTTAYVSGERVTFNGATYEANWWTLGDIPNQNTGQGQPWRFISNVVMDAPLWDSIQNYETGDFVKVDNMLYEAKTDNTNSPVLLSPSDWGFVRDLNIGGDEISRVNIYLDRIVLLKKASQLSCEVDNSCQMCLKWKSLGSGNHETNLDLDLSDDDFVVSTCQSERQDYIDTRLQEYLDDCLEQQQEILESEYRDNCLSTIDDNLSLEYSLGYHHYTLYYYDRAGNLVQTVPPEGVEKLSESKMDTLRRNRLTFDNIKDYGDAFPDPDHHLETKYFYNSIKQLIRQETPDGGTTRFWYNAAGQLVLSQDAQQADTFDFSYTKYDRLGRIIEVGELNDVTFLSYRGIIFDEADDFDDKYQIIDQLWLEPDFPENIPATKKEVHQTFYSQPVVGISCANSPQKNLRNRISYVLRDPDGDLSDSKDQIKTYYSYDPHGNVEWLVQELPEIGRKTISYEYDLVSGNVNQVAYQEGTKEQFMHRYDYDEDNRITRVRTSRDGIVWTDEANYDYYLHGPLARVEVGEDQIQGCDYVYTIEGYLKSINQQDLDPTKDPGQDGSLIEGALADAFGMELGYYKGDYNRSSVNIGSNYSADPYVSQLTETNNSLYNGNIAYWISNTRVGNSSVGTGQTALTTHMNIYRYDKLNRIKQADFKEFNCGQWHDNDGAYDESFTYDANGNITTLKRYNESGDLMDDLEYNYASVGGKLLENRLYHYKENVVGQDGDDLHQILGEDGQPKPFNVTNPNLSNNYQYDAEGNLTRDLNEGISDIEWNVLNKVQSVTKENETVCFEYDAMGMRISKETGAGPTPASKGTYYVYDASGNVMAIYGKEYDATNDETRFNLIEQPIYGSERLGQYRPNLLLQTFDGYVDKENSNILNLNSTCAETSTWLVGSTDGLQELDFIPGQTINITGYDPGHEISNPALFLDDLNEIDLAAAIKAGNWELYLSDLQNSTNVAAANTGENAKGFFLPGSGGPITFFVYPDAGGSEVKWSRVRILSNSSNPSVSPIQNIGNDEIFSTKAFPIVYKDENSRIFMTKISDEGKLEIYTIDVISNVFRQPILRASYELENELINHIGEITVSAQGDKLAVSINDRVLIYDLVIENGEISNPEITQVLGFAPAFHVVDRAEHLEFSPSGNYLYYTTFGSQTPPQTSPLEASSCGRILLSNIPTSIETSKIIANGASVRPVDVQRAVDGRMMLLSNSVLRQVVTPDADDQSSQPDLQGVVPSFLPSFSQQTLFAEVNMLACEEQVPIAKSELSTWVIPTDGNEQAETGGLSVNFDEQGVATSSIQFDEFVDVYPNVALAEDNSGEEVLRFLTIDDKGSDVCQVTVPSFQGVDDSGLSSGLEVSFFNNTGSTGEPFWSQSWFATTSNETGNMVDNVGGIDENWETGFPQEAGAVNADEFGVRWEGWIDIPTDGAYTFYLNSALGSVLSIDDNAEFNDGSRPNYVNNYWFRTSFPRETEQTLNLTEGLHKLRVQMWYKKDAPQQNPSNAEPNRVIQLSWSHAGTGGNKIIVPASAFKYGDVAPPVLAGEPLTVDYRANGLIAEYFEGTTTFEGFPNFSRIEPQINHVWDFYGEDFSEISARWTGFIELPEARVYNFFVHTDAVPGAANGENIPSLEINGVPVTLTSIRSTIGDADARFSGNGSTLVEEYVYQAVYQVNQADVGIQSIKLEYADQNFSPVICRLLWDYDTEGTSQKRIIPSEYFSPVDPATNTCSKETLNGVNVSYYEAEDFDLGRRATFSGGNQFNGEGVILYNGDYQLELEDDGYLALYRYNVDGTRTEEWSSGVRGNPSVNYTIRLTSSFFYIEDNPEDETLWIIQYESISFPGIPELTLCSNGTLKINNTETGLNHSYIHGSSLYFGETLPEDDEITNGTFRMVMQADGNLVVYNDADNSVDWATNSDQGGDVNPRLTYFDRNDPACPDGGSLKINRNGFSSNATGIWDSKNNHPKDSCRSSCIDMFLLSESGGMAFFRNGDKVCAFDGGFEPEENQYIPGIGYNHFCEDENPQGLLPTVPATLELVELSLRNRYELASPFDGLEGNGDFITKFQTYVRVDESGLYQFQIETDGMVVFAVNGDFFFTLSQDPFVEGVFTAPISLEKGYQKMEIYHFGETRSVFDMKWRKPGDATFASIPEDHLFLENPVKSILYTDAGQTIIAEQIKADPESEALILKTTGENDDYMVLTSESLIPEGTSFEAKYLQYSLVDANSKSVELSNQFLDAPGDQSLYTQEGVDNLAMAAYNDPSSEDFNKVFMLTLYNQGELELLQYRVTENSILFDNQVDIFSNVCGANASANCVQVRGTKTYAAGLRISPNGTILVAGVPKEYTDRPSLNDPEVAHSFVIYDVNRTSEIEVTQSSEIVIGLDNGPTSTYDQEILDFDFSADGQFIYYLRHNGNQDVNLYRLDVTDSDPVSTIEFIQTYQSQNLKDQIRRAPGGDLYVSYQNVNGDNQELLRITHAPSFASIAVANTSFNSIGSNLSVGLPLQPYRILNPRFCNTTRIPEQSATRVVGDRYYEVKDHLGNVRVVLTDRRLRETDIEQEYSKTNSFEGSAYRDTQHKRTGEYAAKLVSNDGTVELDDFTCVPFSDVNSNNVTGSIWVYYTQGVDPDKAGIKLCQLDDNRGTDLGSFDFITLTTMGITEADRDQWVELTFSYNVSTYYRNNVAVSPFTTEAIPVWFDDLFVSNTQIQPTGVVADVVQWTDYYAFGSPMPGRKYRNSNGYRYGFNGQEEDDETGFVNFKHRMHDPRLGRFFALDPIAGALPGLTPYNFASDNPVALYDMEGLQGRNEFGFLKWLTFDTYGIRDNVVQEGKPRGKALDLPNSQKVIRFVLSQTFGRLPELPKGSAKQGYGIEFTSKNARGSDMAMGAENLIDIQVNIDAIFEIANAKADKMYDKISNRKDLKGYDKAWQKFQIIMKNYKENTEAYDKFAATYNAVLGAEGLLSQKDAEGNAMFPTSIVVGVGDKEGEYTLTATFSDNKVRSYSFEPKEEKFNLIDVTDANQAEVSSSESQTADPNSDNNDSDSDFGIDQGDGTTIYYKWGENGERITVDTLESD